MRASDNPGRARAGPEDDIVEATISLKTTTTKLVKILLLLLREDGIRIDSFAFTARDPDSDADDSDDNYRYRWLTR